RFQSSSLLSTIDSNRDVRLRQHFCGNATKYYACNPALAMRSHYNKVAALLLGHCEYRFVGAPVSRLYGLALHTGSFCFISYPLQNWRGLRIPLFFCIRAFLWQEYWFNREDSNSGSHRFCERQTMRNSFVGQL